MKKILSIMLALMLALALFGCASGDSKTDASASTSPSDTETQPSPSDTAPATDDAQEPAADDDWSSIQEKGSIVIGITEYAPMNYKDEDGTLIGFDTEFAEKACEKLGLTPEFIVINWETKEMELKSNNIDCIWNGLTVTEDRRENMAFTDSYLTNRQVVVISAENADKYTDAASLKDATVVAESGSAGESAIALGLTDANYIAVDSQANALLEVKAGTADAAVIDYSMAKSMTGEGTDYTDLQIVSAIDMQPEEYAIGFRLDSTAVEKFNEVIATFESDGTFSALAEKYDIADLLIAQ